MIPDVCTWVYDYAMSWLPSWESIGLGSFGVPEDEPRNEEEAGPAPGTAEALARARDALASIERGGAPADARPRPLDARFRGTLAGGGAAAGVGRLVDRLNELETAGLGSGDREALLGAAARLVRRLQQ